MPKYVYKKGADKELHQVGVLPSLTEWNGKSNVGHTHAIKTLNTSNYSSLSVSSSEAISGNGVINLHKVSKTGNFSDLNNRGEAFLSWGGQNFAGSYGPIDSAMVPELGANRLAFMPADAVTIEYSRDGGSTWTDYGPTNSQKIDLFNGRGASFTIGKATSGAGNIATNQYQLRVNIYTGTGRVYTALNKFVIYLSTSGTNSN